MMAATLPAQLLPHAQDSAHAALPPASQPMRVSLAFVAQHVNVYLRFGRPAREIVLDRWRRVAVFMPGAICCRIKWLGDDFGTALWQLMVLQAPTPLSGVQRVSGVSPGARILLRADGEPRVKTVLAAIDAIEAAGLDPCAVAPVYWRMVGNRLAARLPLPAYTPERHAAHLAREALR
ncbi:transposase [Variovorax paradoxus]|uniref:DUF2840 domain-containing protein n=1 Tax=Variovorax paradoxus TaxID=34073 RepID=UPI0006E5A686|nr:transposase [Variovorax paradoxus]